MTKEQEFFGNTVLKSLNKDSYPEPKQVTPYITLRDFAHFEELVISWAGDRNLLKGTTNLLQGKKLYEESHELLCNYIDGKDIRDDIGDNLVVLVQMFHRKGYKGFLSTIDKELKKGYHSSVGSYLLIVADFIKSLLENDSIEGLFEEVVIELVRVCNALDIEDLLECCEVAYNDIKDRKGQMVDGSFVKES